MLIELNRHFNEEHIIQLYKKVPNDITLEDVKEQNKIKKQFNETIDQRDVFNIN